MEYVTKAKNALKRLPRPERGKDFLMVIGGAALVCAILDFSAILVNAVYSLWIFALTTILMFGVGFASMKLMKQFPTFFVRGQWLLIIVLVAAAMAFVITPMIPIVGVYLPEESAEILGTKSATQQMFGFVFILDLLSAVTLLGWCAMNFKTAWTVQFVRQGAQRTAEDTEAVMELTVDLEAP